MPFNNDDEVDYKALREARAADREETRDLENAFKLNIGNNADKLLAILEGRYKPPTIPGEPERITRHVDTPEFVARLGRGQRATMPRNSRRENDEGIEVMNEGNMVPMERSASSNRYAEVTAALDKFDFSTDADRRKWQMSVIASAIRTAIQDLVLDNVASNTKTEFKGHAEKVVKTAGGLKVYFNFPKTKVNVVAKGMFYGDEIIGVYQKDGKIRPRVIRQDGHSQSDISSNFELVIRPTEEQ